MLSCIVSCSLLEIDEFWCSFDDLWSWFVFDYVHVGINDGEVLFLEDWTWRMKKRMKKVEEEVGKH